MMKSGQLCRRLTQEHNIIVQQLDTLSTHCCSCHNDTLSLDSVDQNLSLEAAENAPEQHVEGFCLVFKGSR